MAVNIPVTGTGDTGPVAVATEASLSGAIQILKLAISDTGSITLLPADPAKGIAVEVKSLPPIFTHCDGTPITLLVSPGEGQWTVDGRVGANPVPVSIVPSIQSGYGWDKKAFAAASTTVRTLKGAPGELGGYFIANPNASFAYVQLFDTIATVTLGTTVPDLFIGIPASSAANIAIPGGISFIKAIQFAVATTATGSTAVGTGLDISWWFK